eukprot:Sspe_Gene.73978::Locus_45262_Transcript_1_1_Confidence_1.000_Length_3386::g.73978::m.73978/K18408/TDRD9; ATP-dependent RNA helicase TDRD9
MLRGLLPTTREQREYYASVGDTEATSTAGSFAAASGGHGSRDDVERRIDPANGKAYTLGEFMDYYGGMKEWDLAEPVRRQARSPPRASKHHGDKAAVGQVERRIDPSDMRAYTKEEFVACYRGTKEWESAIRMAVDKEGAPPPRAPPEEKRVDRDGKAYTREEFVQFYGGTAEWNQAPREDEAGGSMGTERRRKRWMEEKEEDERRRREEERRRQEEYEKLEEERRRQEEERRRREEGRRGGRGGRRGGYSNVGQPSSQSEATSTSSITPVPLRHDVPRPHLVPRYPAIQNLSDMPPTPGYRELPVWGAADDVLRAVEECTVCCIQGDTGCGKSSVVPVLLLEHQRKRGKRACIAVTQPRRLAAMALAHRVASQLGENTGETVGYRVAMDKVVGTETQLTYYTAGYLLMYLSHNPNAIDRFTHIVLDEIHERDLDMDLLCLLIRKTLAKHPAIKLVLMSATVEASCFLRYFASSGSPLGRAVYVGQQRFPVHEYFLEELSHALPQCNHRLAAQSCNNMDRDADKISRGQRIRVEIPPPLYEYCSKVIYELAREGICFLVFLPGMADIEQLQEILLTAPEARDRPPALVCILHSIVSNEEQQTALDPAPKGHFKVVLSTNIAESSITVPNVRYVIDFGIHRVMMLDEERGMLTLCNTWCSKGSVLQRRGRCGRLFEGTMLHLYTKSLYDAFPPFAAAEILNTPLESIYIKAKVLLEPIFGPPEELLLQLIDPPPQGRIPLARQNLEDLGAVLPVGLGSGTTMLGRIAVHMPCTVQLTKLVLFGWAWGCAADACVMAAAMSVQDLFKMVAPASVRNKAEFPEALMHNYLVRLRHDDGQFSEPLAYRNLFVSWLRSGQSLRRWADDNCVAISRMLPFQALVAELAGKFIESVPEAGEDAHLRRLLEWKRGRRFDEQGIRACFGSSYDTLRFAIVGAFAPSFVAGEVNAKPPSSTNAAKNKKMIEGSGLPPLSTVVITSLKPECVRDNPELLRKLVATFGPVRNVLCQGSKAFVECDPHDPRVPPSEVVHQMPLLAQLLHQIARAPPCQFRGLPRHEPCRLGSCGFIRGIRWRVAGHATRRVAPYSRSVMGYMCEQREEVDAHYGVAA